MDRETRDKLSVMMHSDDSEICRLGASIFWQSNPTYNDYLLMVDKKFRDLWYNEQEFEKVLQAKIEKYKNL